MLIQRRGAAFRLIRQHDHALLAGVLAFAWRNVDGSGLPALTSLATALHDVVWREEDGRPTLDPATGAPYDFLTIPGPHKRMLVDSGVERLEQVEPEIAALVHAHHRALAEGSVIEPDSALAWLRFFDNLSLFVCLTPPGNQNESRPGWLHAAALRAPDGATLSTAWRGEGELRLSPFPFGGESLVLSLPYRDIPRRRYASQDALTEAWREAREELWSVTLTGPSPP